jgi:hypothetical protein
MRAKCEPCSSLKKVSNWSLVTGRKTEKLGHIVNEIGLKLSLGAG